MKRPSRRLSWSVALGLVVLTLLGARVYLNVTLPRKSVARVEVSENVVGVLSGTTYAYLAFAPDGSVVLIDAGSDLTAQAIKDELQAHGKSAEDVRTVLLTHGLRDHFAGVAAFPNARIYVGQDDHVYASGDKQSRAPYPAVLGRFSKRPPRFRRITDVVSGQRLSFGGLTFDVIAVPGHTPGSVMYVSDGVLFSGDSLLHESDERAGPPPWYMSESQRKLARALKRLTPYEFRTLADGHTGAGPVSQWSVP